MQANGTQLVPKMGTSYNIGMQIIAKRMLRQFWERYPHAETPLRTWYGVVQNSEWRGPADVRAQFGNAADFVGDNRIIFDVGGNKFRLIVHVAYPFRRVLIKFIGTHKDYDKIDPESV
jgi:mRNA interferase HigB